MRTLVLVAPVAWASPQAAIAGVLMATTRALAASPLARQVLRVATTLARAAMVVDLGSQLGPSRRVGLARVGGGGIGAVAPALAPVPAAARAQAGAAGGRRSPHPQRL